MWRHVGDIDNLSYLINASEAWDIDKHVLNALLWMLARAPGTKTWYWQRIKDQKCEGSCKIKVLP